MASTPELHKAACRRYRAAFYAKHGYYYCEVCLRSDKLTQVHHVYYASRHPKHPHLHDFRNLILVCVDCHDAFHGGRLKGKLAELEEERGLKQLFANSKARP